MTSCDRKEKTFVVVCASGFENIGRAKTALMFATLAASANYRTILYAVQDGIDIVKKSTAAQFENPPPGMPTLAQRLGEAIEAGVEILVCSQVMKNRKIKEEDLIEGAQIAGAMTLIQLTAEAEGTLSF